VWQYKYISINFKQTLNILIIFVMKLKNTMMRKLLFSTILFMVVAATASAQCTPGAYTTPGIYPDSATNLPHATVGIAYSTVMTAVIPHDTMGLPFDSIGVVSLTGLPAGFSYVTNSPSGYWAGGPVGGVNTGCLLITGNPTSGQEGTYPLTINIDAVVIGTHNASVLSYYKIIIDPPSSIIDIVQGQFPLMQNVPNPFVYNTIIEFNAPSVETYQFSVINVIGEEVYHQNINAVTGKNVINFSGSELPSGIYLYKLSNQNSTLTKRMKIEK
jgi:hypothetical protein